ncbi:MAG: RidA family protein [Vicinamibacteria bacterium]
MIKDKLKELGLELPQPPQPIGSYVPVQVVGNLVFTSGHTARINGVRRYLGKVGHDVSKDEAYLSARDAALNCLASIDAAVGGLDRVKRIVKVVGFVNSAPGFNQQPSVLDGASDLLLDLFGAHGPHARSAIGAAELPYDASIELEMVVEIEAVS